MTLHEEPRRTNRREEPRRMTRREVLMLKYNGYEALGHPVFAVTLSTYVKSDAIARSDRMRNFWDQHFIYRVKQRLPFRLKEKFDHDFIVERSPEGHYHYHGLMAFTSEGGKRIWRDGALNAQLKRDLDSFRYESDYRPFCVNEHLIEPVRSGDPNPWCNYITKSNDIPMSSTH